MHIPIKRSNNDKVIAGVIGGLAEHFQWNPTIARVLWILLALTPLPGIIGYLVLWMLMEDPEN
ncbi:PspC domain-containing protein [Companilactobacillus sp. HBUAS56275]|uniref:PspC domain-containing protein n=1 Tax=Candidatus Companilactobacillus pullicola TaxID=2838523 RepID=A0A9D1ZLM0_9LACO|nr:PspC domain-containing protein [Candidatus Companilactobacillus pullicola]